MPAGAARPPRSVPTRLAGFRAFPEGEVEGVAFGADVYIHRAIGMSLGRLLEALYALVGQLAVPRVGAHVEVDVAVVGVGVPGVDQPLHQRDHLGHVTGGAWLNGRREYAG